MPYQMPSSIRIETGEPYMANQIQLRNAITGDVVPNVFGLDLTATRNGMSMAVYHTKNWPLIPEEDFAVYLTEAELEGKDVRQGIVMERTIYQIKTLSLEAQRDDRSGD